MLIGFPPPNQEIFLFITEATEMKETRHYMENNTIHSDKYGFENNCKSLCGV